MVHVLGGTGYAGRRRAARIVCAAVCLAASIDGSAMMLREVSITRAFVSGLALLVFGVVVGSILIDRHGGLQVWPPTRDGGAPQPLTTAARGRDPTWRPGGNAHSSL